MVGEKIKNYMPRGMTMKFKCQGPPSGIPPVRCLQLPSCTMAGYWSQGFEPCPAPLTAQQRSYQRFKATVFHSASAGLLTLHTRHVTGSKCPVSKAQGSVSCRVSELDGTSFVQRHHNGRHHQAERSSGMSLNTKQNSVTKIKMRQRN